MLSFRMLRYWLHVVNDQKFKLIVQTDALDSRWLTQKIPVNIICLSFERELLTLESQFIVHDIKSYSCKPISFKGCSLVQCAIVEQEAALIKIKIPPLFCCDRTSDVQS